MDSIPPSDIEAPTPPEPAPPESGEFALVPATGLHLGPVTIGPFLGLMTMATLRDAGIADTWATSAGLALALVVGTVWSLVLRRRRPERLRVSTAGLEVLHARGVLSRVDLGKLREVSELDTGAGPVLLLSDDRTSVALAAQELEQPESYPRLTQLVVSLVGVLDPQGEAARQAVAAGRLRLELAQRPVRATQAMAFVMVLSSILSTAVLLPSLGGVPFPLETAGALSAALVRAGETWRLASAPFLHLGPGHLFVTLLGLLGLGGTLERLVGWERMIVAFVAGTVAGAYAYTLQGLPLPAAGASAGLFGLVGLLGAVASVGRRRLPKALLPGWRFWLLAPVYALILPSFGSMSPWSHLAAAAAGWIAGVAMIAGEELPSPEERRAPWRPFAILSIAALAVGLAGSVTHGRRQHALDDEWVVRAYLMLPATEASAALQNDIAFPMVSSPAALPSALHAGARLSEAAVENSGRKQAAILDTLAVARYRLGDVDEAKELLQEALKLAPSPTLKDLLERRLKDVEAGRPVDPTLE